MNPKRYLENRIHGWLPKEPTLPSRDAPIQGQQKYENQRARRSSFLVIPALSVFFMVYSVISSFSTVTILLLATILVVAIASLASLLVSRGTTLRILKCLVFIPLIFAISFTGAEYYLINYGGYPPTYSQSQPGVTLSYPNLLNVSMTQTLNSLEQGVTFHLLRVEHLGSVTFDTLRLGTEANGEVYWTFYAKDTNVFITVLSAAGHPYYVYTYPNPGVTLPQNYPTAQNIKESFAQIDALGLRWFYDQASQTYQNKTGNKATLSDLNVELAFKNKNNHDGVTIQVTGRNSSYDNRGNRVAQPVFSYEFLPNGTLIY